MGFDCGWLGLLFVLMVFGLFTLRLLFDVCVWFVLVCVWVGYNDLIRLFIWCCWRCCLIGFCLLSSGWIVLFGVGWFLFGCLLVLMLVVWFGCLCYVYVLNSVVIIVC